MHDLGIGADIGRRGSIAGQCAQIGETADVRQLAVAFKIFCDRDRIGRLLVGRQRRIPSKIVR